MPSFGCVISLGMYSSSVRTVLKVRPSLHLTILQAVSMSAQTANLLQLSLSSWLLHHLRC